jgi:predicted phage terminase large subunit-like protein
MSDLLEWEDLDESRRQAVKALSEHDFLTFVRIWFQLTMGDKLMISWHHRYMAHYADELVAGRQGSFVLNIPPGGTKTEFWSIALPAYAHIKAKNRCRFLNLSFADSLVKRNSRRTKDMIKSEAWQHLWPSNFKADQAEEWQIADQKGRTVFEVVSRTMGGQITGGRGGYPGPGFSGAVMQDDPDKPEDMFSSVKRERQHRIQVDTIRSRRGDKSKNNPTPIGVIQQRTHQLDTSGFCLSGGMGINFDLIKIPALINDGYIQALPEWIRDKCWESVKDSEQINGYWSYWPEMEDIGQLMDLWERNEYTFQAQYMQTPIALGGQIFHSDWWKFYGDQDGCDEARPITFEYRFITGDTAMKTGERNDFSVLMCWGVWNGRLYLLDVLRGKWEAPELRAMFINFVAKHWDLNTTGNHGILRSIHIEDKASGTGLIQEAGRQIQLPITAVQRGAGQNKTVRARDAAPQIKLGKVLLPMGEPWVMDFVSEHSQFTEDDSHDWDDQVDNTCDAVEIAITRPGQSVVNMLLSTRQQARAYR